MSFLKGVKALVLYNEDWGIVMEPMQRKLASSQFDLGHTDLFCIPEVTSGFFLSCDSVVGDSLIFNQANRGPYVFDWENVIALNAMQVNRASSRGEGEVSRFFASCGRHLGYILELRR